MLDTAARIAARKLRDRRGHVDCMVFVLPMEYVTVLLGFPDWHANSTPPAMQTIWDTNAHHKVYVLATIWATSALEATWAEIWDTTTTLMPSSLLPMTQASTQHVKTWCSSSISTGRRLSDCR